MSRNKSRRSFIKKSSLGLACSLIEPVYPFHFNTLEKDNSINSVFNGVTVTIDMINDSPNKIKILTLRSFGESLYHSLTDSCLEFGYKNY